jgi:translation initiation factor IF-2
LAKIKLNIKNTQLAAAFGKTKESKESAASPSQLEKEKETVVDVQEPKKKLTRLKEDSTALKQAEKTTREKEIELAKEPPKRKARIMKTLPEGEKTDLESPIEEVPAGEPRSTAVTSGVELEPSRESEVAETTSTTEPPAHAITKPTTPSLKEKEAGFTALPKKVEPPAKAKELKTVKKKEEARFDSRDRQGLRDVENEAWRKRRQHKPIKRYQEEVVIRPKHLSVRLPITIKDLAQDMKLKASQLIAKLLMKGIVLTLNDYLDDETTIQLLGHDFDCDITIDTSEEKRIRITDQTIRQEIEKTKESALVLRSPVVTFMGHVDHGKTSLIDSIRKSNRVAGEAGAITQHIGAFKVKTAAGDVTILDTPGHEAFFEMRSRGANVTDIVILVIAGDEGVRAQTDEAIRQAREAKCPILVALNKSDKANFDAQKVYRELADRDLLPEAWGGTTIAVNCSAASGAGVNELLEMIALQAEILELKANPHSRARGTILESEMHKGLGAVATVLVQNGTLRKNDAIVFGSHFGRIKTMQDEYGKGIEEAGPSMPVKITGLSDLALAGSEFIVVKTEKEARDLAEARSEGELRSAAQAKISSLEKMMARKESGEIKILPVILRADVQGSLEALKSSLLKIHSKKVRLEIVSADVGEISESDIDLALASKSTIIGFHTHIESHAADQIKQKKVPVLSHDVIYHIVDDVKERMKALLDKLEQETETGKALIKAVFKSSQLGMIAGCQITEGIIKRNCLLRQIRDKEVIWKGKISSLKRGKEEVKEVKEGFECGILLEGQRNDIKEGDLLEAYEITYLEQDL